MLDLDATDDPLHRDQEGRFFHGYYRSYCYLPLYIFDGRHLLVAKLRRANSGSYCRTKVPSASPALVRQTDRRLGMNVLPRPVPCAIRTKGDIDGDCLPGDPRRHMVADHTDVIRPLWL